MKLENKVKLTNTQKGWTIIINYTKKGKVILNVKAYVQ